MNSLDKIKNDIGVGIGVGIDIRVEIELPQVQTRGESLFPIYNINIFNSRSQFPSYNYLSDLLNVNFTLDFEEIDFSFK